MTDVAVIAAGTVALLVGAVVYGIGGLILIVSRNPGWGLSRDAKIGLAMALLGGSLLIAGMDVVGIQVVP